MTAITTDTLELEPWIVQRIQRHVDSRADADARARLEWQQRRARSRVEACTQFQQAAQWLDLPCEPTPDELTPALSAPTADDLDALWYAHHWRWQIGSLPLALAAGGVYIDDRQPDPDETYYDLAVSNTHITATNPDDFDAILCAWAEWRRSLLRPEPVP